jgi:hypothetical protein
MALALPVVKVRSGSFAVLRPRSLRRSPGLGAAGEANREIAARADEGAPAVRIAIGGNIPLDGMRAGTPPALPMSADPDAIAHP